MKWNAYFIDGIFNYFFGTGFNNTEQQHWFLKTEKLQNCKNGKITEKQHWFLNTEKLQNCKMAFTSYCQFLFSSGTGYKSQKLIKNDLKKTRTAWKAGVIGYFWLTQKNVKVKFFAVERIKLSQNLELTFLVIEKSFYVAYSIWDRIPDSDIYMMLYSHIKIVWGWWKALDCFLNQKRRQKMEVNEETKENERSFIREYCLLVDLLIFWNMT